MSQQKWFGIWLSELDIFRRNDSFKAPVQLSLLENVADFGFTGSRGNRQRVAPGSGPHGIRRFGIQYCFLPDRPEIITALPFDQVRQFCRRQWTGMFFEKQSEAVPVIQR